MTDSKKLTHAQVTFAHGPITLPFVGKPPKPMNYDDAIKVLEKKRDEENTLRRFTLQLSCHPLDGGRATEMAMSQLYGAVLAHPQTRASTHTVTVGGVTHNIPWGRFLWPLEADDQRQWVATSVAQDALGNGVFQLVAELQAKYEPQWDMLCQTIRMLLRDHSILLGNTIRITFTDDDNDALPFPALEEWDVRDVDTSMLCYTKATEQIIAQFVYGPIDNYHAFVRAGERFNRGILSTGPFGTGKTMLNASIAQHAQRAGMTVFYTTKASDAARCLRFAQLYATRERPAVVFIEDIERICDGPDVKTEEVNELMNVLDGVDTKTSNVMFICTTNHYEKLFMGLKRSRRIDLTINILAPDAEAAARIVRAYLSQPGTGMALYDDNVDWQAVGAVCDGMVAADISEVCTRAKVAHIATTGVAPTPGSIQTGNIITAAHSVAAEIEMRRPTQTREVPALERAALLIASALSKSTPEMQEFRRVVNALPVTTQVQVG